MTDVMVVSKEGWGNDVLLNEKESSGTNHNSSYNVTMMMQLSRKLSRMGRNIALKVDYGSNASSTDRKNLSTTHYFKNNTEKVQNQKIEDEIDGYNYRVQAGLCRAVTLVAFSSVPLQLSVSGE